jgi:lipopolysaccharide export system permease protein
VPFLLIISSKESSAFIKLRFLTFLIGLIFIIFSETTIRFISQDLTNNFIISIIPITIFLILYLIFLNKFNFIKKIR